MRDTPGLVSRIIDFSMVDGPGSRMAIFLQGCNLRCIACHNPHTMGECDACGRCFAGCPGAALGFGGEGLPRYEQGKCLQCGRCEEVCLAHASPRAQYLSSEQVLDRLRKISIFLSGVTATGGEATGQADFVENLFGLIKSEPKLAHLSTMIDSNGMTEPQIWDRLMGVMDYAAIDLKAVEPRLHERLTGKRNEQVLASIRKLSKNNKLLELRILLIDGLNDTDDEAQAAGAFLASEIGPVQVRLMAFRQMGVRKEYGHLREASKEALARYREHLIARGATNVRIG